jgi:hypothetical protein
MQALVQFGGDAAEQVDVLPVLRRQQRFSLLSWERLAETPNVDVLADLELCVNLPGLPSRASASTVSR